jgi:uncharacterized protein (DUF849 family)
MAARKVIITCAVTGSIHTPSMSPHIPITAQEIAEAAIGAAEAGAAIVHLHARDPKDGRPDQSTEAFAPFLKVIKQRSSCVVNITTGGAATMTIDERLKPVATFKPEVASLNMGSMNFGLFPMLARFKSFKHDWERPYLESSKDRIFKNTFADIEKILTTCADNGTRFEIECYDIGHLYTLAHFVDQGLVKPPFFVQSVFGILGGIGPHPEDVVHMKRTADRLFGNDYRWSVLGAGRNQMPIAAIAAAMGGNVRVGLEDSLWIGPGKLAESNATQVRHVRSIIEGLGLSVASAEEAREVLELKVWVVTRRVTIAWRIGIARGIAIRLWVAIGLCVIRGSKRTAEDCGASRGAGHACSHAVAVVAMVAIAPDISSVVAATDDNATARHIGGIFNQGRGGYPGLGPCGLSHGRRAGPERRHRA